MPQPLPDFNKLWNYQRPAETEEKFRELLPAAQAGGDANYLLQLQTQIARAQGKQGEFAEAHATLDMVEKEMHGPGLALVRARYYLERGRAFNSSDQPAKALPLFVEAYKEADAAREWRYAIDAVHMVAIAEPDTDRQVEWGLKGIAMVEEHPEQSGWLWSLYNNLGEAYRVQKEYAKALECFEKCADFSRGPDGVPDMFVQKDVAHMLRLMGQPDAALAIIEPIAVSLRAKNEPDGYIYSEYGQCLVALSRAEASSYLVEAYKMLSADQYMVTKEPEELEILRGLVEDGVGED